MTTAIYPNRIEDKAELEAILSLSEEGNLYTQFYLADGTLFAIGYTRIVYGDHGPYIEFTRDQIAATLSPKFNNSIDLDNLPINPKYYYYWLYPDGNPDIKVYLQLKPVTNLPNAPRRLDGKPSAFNRKEGYADYKRGYIYVDPYVLIAKVL